MEIPEKNRELFDLVANKSYLKTTVYNNTVQAFEELKSVTDHLSKEYTKYHEGKEIATTIDSRQRGAFEVELKFGGDILLFLMHTNVFEFPRDHEVMKTQYIKDDNQRSYCGIINIYNFIADSFKYNRLNDVGYLIGRIFVNKENHYFIEGKRELGFLYNNFGKNVLTPESVEDIVLAAIKYTVNFDLLTPHYDIAKFVSVNDMKHALESTSLKTGKRLGYKFQADFDEE